MLLVVIVVLWCLFCEMVGWVEPDALVDPL